jgi:hypothetical protein
MKRIFSIALIAVVALFTACDKSEEAGNNGANFKLTSSNQFEVDVNGGTKVITYSIANHISGETVATEIKQGEAAVKAISHLEGVIIVEFDANTTSSTRIIIIRATYGNESFDVVFSQKAGGSISGQFDEVFEGTYLNGYYYGEDYGEGADLYLLHISDKPMNNAGQLYSNATYYRVYVNAPLGNACVLPNGKYTFSATDTLQTYVIVGKYSKLYLTGTDDSNTKMFSYTDAKMIVGPDKVELELTIEGKRHKVTYNGSLECMDVRENGDNGDDGGDSGNNNDPTGGQDGEAKSTYTSDHNVTFDGEHRAKWGYEGDYWKTGYSNYTIYIMNKSNGYVYGDTLQFDLITDNKSQDGDFDGKYTISNTPGKMVMMAGFTNNYAQAVGSWLLEYGSGSDMAGFANYAMLKSGSAEFINNGDGTHTVKLNAYDCLGNNITCNWTGVIEKD